MPSKPIAIALLGSGTAETLPALNTIVSAVVVSSTHVCVPAAMPSPAIVVLANVIEPDCPLAQSDTVKFLSRYSSFALAIPNAAVPAAVDVALIRFVPGPIDGPAGYEEKALRYRS
jgi:hypothetical protein